MMPRRRVYQHPLLAQAPDPLLKRKSPLIHGDDFPYRPTAIGDYDLPSLPDDLEELAQAGLGFSYPNVQWLHAVSNVVIVGT